MIISQKQLKRFRYLANRPQSMQRNEMMSSSFLASGLCVHSEGQNHNVLIDSLELEKTYNNLRKKVINKSGWRKHLLDYKKLRKRVLENFKTPEKTIVSFNNKYLLNYIKKNWKLMDDNTDYITFPFFIEDYLESDYNNFLINNFTNHEKIYSAVSSLGKMILYQKMRIEICRAVISPKLHSVDNLIDNFSWRSIYNYLEKPLDRKYFLGEIKKLNKSKARQEIKEIKDTLKENRQKYYYYQKKIKNPYYSLMTKIINTYVHLRTDRVDIWKMTQYKQLIAFKEMARRLTRVSNRKWNLEMVVALLNSEIINFLAKGDVPEYNEVKKRTPGNYVYYHDYLKNKSYIITDKKEVKRIKNHFLSNKSLKTIKGVVAFKGKHKGRVRLVFSKKDLVKVRKGEILVARHTMPDYTIIMKRAGAIITDDGGITCHAAITARELSKPCIIGTKIATQMLKNNNLVEIDADKGVIKILN